MPIKHLFPRFLNVDSENNKSIWKIFKQGWQLTQYFIYMYHYNVTPLSMRNLETTAISLLVVRCTHLASRLCCLTLNSVGVRDFFDSPSIFALLVGQGYPSPLLESPYPACFKCLSPLELGTSVLGPDLLRFQITSAQLHHRQIACKGHGHIY